MIDHNFYQLQRAVWVLRDVARAGRWLGGWLKGVGILVACSCDIPKYRLPFAITKNCNQSPAF